MPEPSMNASSLIPGFTYPEVHRHRSLRREIVRIGENVHAFVGYGISNFSIVTGTDGYILIDTGSSEDFAEEALKDIARITPLPLASVIFTHSHPDHTGGLGMFLEQGVAGAEKKPEGIPVWGRVGFGAEYAGYAGLEHVSARRAGRQFGVRLSPERTRPNSMVPVNPALGRKPRGPARITQTFREESLTLSIAGIALELHAAPGETTDHLFVRLPESGVIFTGDTAYRSFPNLYPIRGSGYRDVTLWAASARKILALRPSAIVMGHNEPAFGEEALELLKDYSDAIQHVYDETVRGMDQGLGPDELAVTVQLPPHLREKPWLGEFYGSVPWAVRSIYSGLLGWFDGNPTRLVPLVPEEEAERMASLAGGAAGLRTAAEAALSRSDWRWAAQLADYCLRLSPGDAALKLLKAEALEALSQAVLPITGYNYLQSCAQELREEASMKQG